MKPFCPPSAKDAPRRLEERFRNNVVAQPFCTKMAKKWTIFFHRGLLPNGSPNISRRSNSKALMSVTFLAGHGGICPPHMGDPHGGLQTSPQHADPHGLGAFLKKTIQEIHVDRRVVGWSSRRHVDHPPSPIFVGSSEGHDWKLQARLHFPSEIENF